MTGKILGSLNSIAGWVYIYMHATHRFEYFDDERWIPYVIIVGVSILLASTAYIAAANKNN